MAIIGRYVNYYDKSRQKIKEYLCHGDEVIITNAIGIWDSEANELVITKLEHGTLRDKGNRVCRDIDGRFYVEILLDDEF